MQKDQDHQDQDADVVTDKYRAHGMANEAQVVYFMKREQYKSLTNKELVDSLKIYEVPEVILEIIEGRLAGMESV